MKTRLRSTSRSLPPRAVRLMQALLAGPVEREKADRTAPASNGPHYIGLIRKRLGIVVKCERVPFVTKDGDSSWYGRYVITPEERKVILDYLQAKECKE